MRKLFFSFMAVCLAMTTSAQQTDKQMATLQHGDKTTVYYGPDALVEAYNAAADTLDVITLSPGEFRSMETISKSVAIYGAGFERDTITGTDRTYISSSIFLSHANKYNEDGYLYSVRPCNGTHLEGLFVNGSIYFRGRNNVPVCNVEIVKCWSNISFEINNYNNTIRQCRIPEIIPCIADIYCENLLFSNCHIESMYSTSGITNQFFSSTSTITFDHSILRAYRVKNGSVRKASCVYAHSFISLKRKNGMSETPLN